MGLTPLGNASSESLYISSTTIVDSGIATFEFNVSIS